MQEQKNSAARGHNFKNPNPILQQYTLQEKIGEGAFGKVYRGINNSSGLPRAIKKIYKKKVTDYKMIISEIDSLKKLDHPNLIKMIEYHEEKNKIYLVQELLLGEALYDRLANSE